MLKKEGRIIVIGDVMLDHYIEGTCDRISPEAPVPVVHNVTETYRLGGAANVAHNISTLGMNVALIGAVGHDEAGNTLKKILDNNFIEGVIFESNTQTTVKSRIVSSNQQLLRIDKDGQYKIKQGDIENIYNYLTEYAPDIIIMSDYNKGVICPEIVDCIHNYCVGKDVKILVDPKVGPYIKYGAVDIIKPNKSEVVKELGIHIHTAEDVIANIQNIQKLSLAKSTWITLSGQGSVHLENQNATVLPSKKVEVYDVTGAGDTAIAILAVGLLQDLDLSESIELASMAATLSVTKPKTHSLTETELYSLIKIL